MSDKDILHKGFSKFVDTNTLWCFVVLRLSGVLGRYITTRLDDAEVALTRAESSIDKDDGDYLDLEAARKALDTFEVSNAHRFHLSVEA